MTFNLILLKHFASGLGPRNIGFLLGVGLENSTVLIPALMVSLFSGKPLSPLDHDFLKYVMKNFDSKFLSGLKLYEISANFKKAKYFLRGRGNFVKRICT